MDVNLIVGGTAAPSYPNCDGTREFVAPFPKRVAYEYANGYYTLGWPLDPSNQKHQKQALAAGNLAIGDYILLYVIPEHHSLGDIFVRVENGDPALSGTLMSVTILEHESASNTYSELRQLTQVQLFEDDARLYHNFNQLVPTGTSHIVALKIDSLPTDTSVLLSNMKAKVTVVSKVFGYDCPSHV